MGLGLERVLNPFLFNARGVDILAYAIVPSLLVVTMLAAYVPARRGSLRRRRCDMSSAVAA